MSSLAVSFSRVTLTGLAARSSSANRFLSHLQLNGAQLRNFAVCASGGLPICSREQLSRFGDGKARNLAALQSINNHHQSLRHFFKDASNQVPDKQPKTQSDDGIGKSSPTDGGSGSSMQQEEPAKLGLFARFKKMYKEYWYVLVPVHCVTSVFWYGGFYYASKSGVDVIALLESMGVSQKLIDPVRDSSLGHIAVAYLLYKIATPARYTVTLGEYWGELGSGIMGIVITINKFKIYWQLNLG